MGVPTVGVSVSFNYVESAHCWRKFGSLALCVGYTSRERDESCHIEEMLILAYEP